MKKTLIALACLLSASVMAGERGNYAGLQYGLATYSETGFPDFDPQILIFRFGYKFNKNLSVEGRVGTGISKGTKTVLSVPLSLEVNSFYGIYAVGTLPINDRVGVYGLVGYTDAELTASSPGVSVSGTDSDISYGVGVDIGATNNVSWNLEYTSYIDESNVALSSISIGANFAF